MPTNRLLTSLQQGRPIIGCSHVIQDESVTETLRGADLDFLFIDMQHVAITIETLQRTLIALQPTELSVLVRPLTNDAAAIGQALDAGADGVIVPMVNTVDDARRAVAAGKYPPEGTRSWGPRRAQRLHGGPVVYAREANGNALVITQVETAEAVENIEDILSVPGLAGVAIGPADLAISMGFMHDRENPEVLKTMEKVLQHCLARSVPFGFFASSLAQGMGWMERGALVICSGSDTGFVANGLQQMSAEVAARRAKLQARPALSVAGNDRS